MDRRVGLEDINTIPKQNPNGQVRHTWTPRSLIDLAQNPPAPPDIAGILYTAKRSLISGETESMKTWLALIIAKAEIEQEQPVVWVDVDDMGAGALLQRLRSLAVPDQHIHDYFMYYQPDEALRGHLMADFLMQLTVLGARVMIIDAFNPMLSLHGLDFMSTTDIQAFWREVAEPITKTGCAPILLDHVVKNADNRGKYASGSERKASGCQVHLGTHLLNPLTIGNTGRTLLNVHKDRPGYLQRPSLGVLTLESDGTWITYRLDPDKSHEGGRFRPTILMERVSKLLEEQTEPKSENWIVRNTQGNNNAIPTAIHELTDSGYLHAEDGPRNSTIYTTIKPYREDEEPTTHDLPPTSLRFLFGFH